MNNMFTRVILGAGCILLLAGAGPVRLEGRALRDDAGPFLGLGATYMQALRHFKYDRDRFERETACLARSGFGYVRVLSIVAWDGKEIAPVDFRNREDETVAAWPDYDEQFVGMLEALQRQGLRAEVTIFADAQRVMPEPEVKRAHVERMLELVKGREPAVCMLEVANEAWQNGFPGEEGIGELRALGKRLAEATDVLVALSSPSDLSDRAGELAALYRGSAADIATMHFSRDTRGPWGAWEPVIAPWEYTNMPGIPPISSNEPIGPGSSVASETDPARILAAASFAYIAGLPMYVFHSSAGVAAESSFDEIPWLDRFGELMKILPRDLPNWQRNDGLEPAAPFTVYLDGKANEYWQETGDHRSGLLRACGATSGVEFVALALGILPEGAVLEAREAMTVTEYALPECAPSPIRILAKGQRLELGTGSGACILRGRLTHE